MTAVLSDPVSPEGVYASALAERAERASRRRESPLVRLWDGDWNFRGRVFGEISSEFRWVLNDTGTGTIVLPADHHLAKWAASFRSRGTKNVHVTVDKDGARWGGRVSKVSTRKVGPGEYQTTLEFADFIEDLKHIRVWSNPVLPSIIQFPRVFMLAGPSIWALKLALFLNLMRNQNSLFTLPDNPLDFSLYVDNLNMENWPVSMKGQSFLGDSSPHAIVSSRFKNWHEMATPILNDAQLMVKYDIYLDGDPDPWPGYTPRNGQVIYDIVDKSGWWGSTGTGGNVLNGIARTLLTLSSNGVDSSRTIVSDPNRPTVENGMGTPVGYPWVVYRDGPFSGLESTEWSWEPATDVQVVVGGKSVPGANEIISVAVQLAGDVASAVMGGFAGNVGQMADTLLKPLYTDTILAWMSFKSFERAQDLGWSHYFEYMPGNSDQAWTLSSLMAIRRGWWETRERIAHTFEVGDGAPYLIGENGQGHFFLGDRIGAVLPGLDDGTMAVEMVTELRLSHSREGMGWEITVGDPRTQEDGVERMVRKVSEAVGAVQELGVF